MIDDVESNKLYLKSDISLLEIGKQVGLNSQKASSIINQYARKNFNDFINGYRIKEAKLLLINKDNNQFTIASIAYDVGFNSLSSFNTAFKKIEGVTPSQYRKAHS